MIRFILVRHGQTEWNRSERFRGQVDIALNPVGLAQAEATAAAIAARWRPGAVYCSPMRRAWQTAHAIAGETGLPVQTHADLADIHFGQIQGLLVDEVRQRWPELLDQWYHAPGQVQFPGGESLPVVRRRGLSAVAELAARHPEQTVVLVGHTVINRAILLGILDVADQAFWRLGQEPCCINVFESGGPGWVLTSLNDTGHLPVAN